MKKFIYKHLDQEYEITTSNVGNYGIYQLITKEEKYRVPRYGNHIITEISTIFNIDLESSKRYVCKWAREKVPNVDLTFYWQNNYSGTIFSQLGASFPEVRMVMASTLGSELVSVQPMSKPINQSFHLDYQYEKKTWYNQNVFYTFVKNIVKKIKQYEF